MRLRDVVRLRPHNTDRLLDATLRRLRAALTELEAEERNQRERPEGGP